MTAYEAKFYLYDHKAGATVVGTLEVDGALIMRDVEALDCGSLLEVHRSRLCEGKREERGEKRKLHIGRDCTPLSCLCSMIKSVCKGLNLILVTAKSLLDRWTNNNSGGLYIVLFQRSLTGMLKVRVADHFSAPRLFPCPQKNEAAVRRWIDISCARDGVMIGRPLALIIDTKQSQAAALYTF